MTKQLLVDFGNTRIKWSINEKPFTSNWCKIGQIDVLLEFISKNEINEVATACMRKTNDYLQLNCFLKKHQIRKSEISINTNLLLPNYQNLSSFGIDRYLDMIGAKSLTENSFCIIDAGTALTIDFFDASSQKHLGGTIGIGIGLQREMLSDKTGLSITEITDSPLGTDTQSSLCAGIFNSTKYSINGLIYDIEKRYQINFKRFYTGGDAKYLANHKSNVFEKLIFSGMNYFLLNTNLP